MEKLSNGRRVCDRYVLLERIGAGGHGELWRVYDEEDGRELALKILHPSIAGSPEAWTVLQHEFEMVKRLDHPGILQTEAPVRVGESAALPMEFASAGDLRRLRAQSYLRIVPVLVHIAEVLEHAHRRGVVHRDLKPGNVLFDARGGVRLADFGAAGLTGSNDMLAAGSPFSASPQQLRNEPASPADDIYGLGALGYELLSGYPPFYPEFELQKVLTEPVPPLTPVHPTPPRLVQLVMSMLAKDARQRPASMREVIDRLNATLMDSLGIAAEDESQTLLLPVGGLQEVMGANHTAELPVRGLDGDATVESPVREAAAERITVHVPPAPSRPAQPAMPRQGPPAAPGDQAQVAPDAKPVVVEPRVEARAEPRVAAAVGPVPGDDAPRVAYGALPPRPVRRRRRARSWVPWTAGIAVALVIGAALPLLARWQAARLAAARPATVQLAEPAPPVDTTLAADPAPDVQAAREEYAAALAQLEKQQAGSWAGRPFAAAKAAGEAAERSAETGQLEQAAAGFRQATQSMQAVAAGAPVALRRELDAGHNALAQGRALLAGQHFERAGRIDAGSAEAQRGMRDAVALDQALNRMAEGARAEETGQQPRALALYGEAARLAPEFLAAQQARDRLAGQVGADAHARAVAEGLEAMGDGRLATARASFEHAQQLQPGSPAARDGLERVQRVIAAQDFEAQRRTAAELEEAERWKDAVEDYQRALDLDGTLGFARSGLERASARAELGSRLDGLIARPDRLGSNAVYADAINTLQRAREIAAPGPVLRSQIARLELLLEDFNRPVEVALESDNSTNVSIARVGPLGSFTHRMLTLRPGTYTVIGTRAGFRDVRREILLQPGQRGTVVSVQCTDPI